ncbi:MAG: hypothetical protein Q8K55_05750 [Gemmatimonadaceae bacterium]|nr:hypothetical protein [Gemmatimonadaceae bacterium]
MNSHENRISRFAHGGKLQAAGGALLGAFFAILLRVAGIGPRVPLWLMALGGAAVGWTIFRFVTRAIFTGSEELTKQLVMPDAKGTYAPQYSHIQALEVQERYAEALRAWLVVAESQPGNPSPLLRGADLQLRYLKDAPGALELYERARRMPGIREEHVRYASQKIIDVHLTPGGDAGRALVELRRFVMTFPDGREADGARAAIARLKAEQLSQD